MIVVAIIGVLMAIAFPQYTSYVRRAQVTEATAGLSEMRVKMEQYSKTIAVTTVRQPPVVRQEPLLRRCRPQKISHFPVPWRLIPTQ